MVTALLTTKLYTPSPRPDWVPRPRLIQRLDAGPHLGHRLTLISAPAGFGKTSLLSEWVGAHRDAPLRVAWVSLDEGDNDPVRFISYLVAALQTVVPDLGTYALEALQPQPFIPEALLTGLINQLNTFLDASRTDPGFCLILVLDDYHLIAAQSIHDAVAFLLEHLPAQMHVAIASRADPPLPIARLRGRGQLTELRQSDLCFTSQEALQFLRQATGLDLSPADVAALASRTEGWIAGLQMAAISMQQRDDPGGFVQAFTGSNRYILDYLFEEVLKRQPQDIQAFLLQTSILDRLTGPLCDALLDIRHRGLDDGADEIRPPTPTTQSQILGTQSPSQQVLEHLEATNLFIVPLDDQRQWYRYHRLFADLLRQRLELAPLEPAPVLHRRASAWYEGRGLISEAIAHALSAGDFERAAHLIEENAEATLMRSEVATLLTWLDRLPDEQILDHPSLCVYHAWALLWSGRPWEEVNSRLGNLARLEDAAGEELLVSAKAEPLRAFVAIWQGRISHAAELATRALEQLPEDDSFSRGIALLSLATTYYKEGDIAAWTQMLDEVARTSREAGNFMIAVIVLCNLAERQRKHGELHRAMSTYQQALELASDDRGHRLPIAGEALVGMAEISREWNQLEKAIRSVQEGIELTLQWGEVAAMEGHMILARIRRALGDVDGAAAALEIARQLAAKFDATELDDIAVAWYQARLWIAQGNLEPARRWAEERQLERRIEQADAKEGDEFLDYHLRKYELPVLARLHIAQDQPGDALALLEPLIQRNERQQRVDLLLECLVLKALALQEQGDILRALTSLERALSLGEPEGYARIFVDEGEPMARLLRHAASQGIMPEYASRLVAAFGAPDYPGSPRPPVHAPPQPLIDPLSDREMEVLRLLSAGLSNPDIAQELYIATSTVRSHLKSIYSKLNVHKRWDAVQRAEELGLL
jgi:LuxR family maltose regulon positive regulatory protein